MIPESPNLPQRLQPEDRFIYALKNELRRHAQEINKRGIGGESNVYVKYEQFNQLKKFVEDLSRRTPEEQDWTKHFTINEEGKLCQIMEG